VAYLDISPMLAALREQPATFSMAKGWLKHRPSRHRFKVDAAGHVIIDAECGCSGLSVRLEQGRKLYEALQVWREEYWVPHQVNQHFGAHFRPAPLWRRWWNSFVAFWTGDGEDGALALYGRAWAECGRTTAQANNPPPPDGPRWPTQPRPLVPPGKIRREPEDIAV
jgi:hypothetical protein